MADSHNTLACADSGRLDRRHLLAALPVAGATLLLPTLARAEDTPVQRDFRTWRALLAREEHLPG